jgi:hypothetical protein
MGAVYVPRSPTTGVLYGVVRGHWRDFAADVRDRTDGLGLSTFVVDEFRKFLRCGVLVHGFTRVRCADCAATGEHIGRERPSHELRPGPVPGTEPRTSQSARGRAGGVDPRGPALRRADGRARDDRRPGGDPPHPHAPRAADGAGQGGAGAHAARAGGAGRKLTASPSSRVSSSTPHPDPPVPGKAASGPVYLDGQPESQDWAGQETERALYAPRKPGRKGDSPRTERPISSGSVNFPGLSCRRADGHRDPRRERRRCHLPLGQGQYTTAEFGDLCANHGMTQSMGKTGICWDNALAESFFAT